MMMNCMNRVAQMLNGLNTLRVLNRWTSQYKKSRDHYTRAILRRRLSAYKDMVESVDDTNKYLFERQIRLPNFPEDVSENIAKFALATHFDSTPIWEVERSDLEVDGERVEVKAFVSDGPSSFGHREPWDHLCFVDARNFRDNHFRVYLISIPNTHPDWMNLKITKRRTFADKCKKKIRPRIKFDDVIKQIPQHIKLIFDGGLNDL